MRILGITDRPFPLIGGAEISLALLLSQLKTRHGHTCRMAGLSAYTQSSDAFGVRITSFRDPEELVEQVRQFRPDVLISSLLTSVHATRVALRFGVPHVAWHPSYEFAPPTRSETIRWSVDPDREYPARDTRRFVHDNADAVLTNSRHVQRWFLRREGVSSIVVHPPIDPAAVVGPAAELEGERPPPARRYVSGVCGYEYKGVRIFAGLADAMPDVEFLLAGRVAPQWLRVLESKPNVTLRPFGPPRDYLDRSLMFIVPSQWPEPFGRVAVESMAAGVPTLVSRTGGLREIAGGGEASVARFRSVEAWQRALDRLLADRGLRERLAAEGRRRAAPYLGGRSAQTVDRIVRRLAARSSPDWSTRHVVIAGSTTAPTAFAKVNAHWVRHAAQRGRPMIAAEPEVADSQSADVQIRSDFTAPFEAWPAPPDGYLVAARTWDFGPFPKAWVERIEADYDRLWVHTQWIREQAVASGIPPERVAVVPLGVDPDVFQPDGPAMRLPGGRRPKPFTFLFVGAPVMRKGFDVLLRAWALAFRRTSGVRLVVKANPRDVFYAGARQIELLHALRRDADAAPVEFIDRHLPAARLAALYRAADVAVFPYRAEGFCLPILEAMACGTPVIAPRFGAALDFCSEASSWLVPARRIAVPVNRTFAFNTLGFTQEIDAVDFCEVPADALADLMRDVAAADPRARARKATRGLAVARRFTWAASVNAIAKDLALISRQGPPRRFRQSRDSAEAHRRTLKIAETLYRRGSRL